MSLHGRELGLDLVHLHVVDLEGLGQHVRGNWRCGTKKCCSYCLRSLKLAVEAGDGDDCGRTLTPVLLEVDEPPREDEDITHDDGLAEELVGGGDETDFERALENIDDLGSSGMCVRRVLAARA